MLHEDAARSSLRYPVHYLVAILGVMLCLMTAAGARAGLDPAFGKGGVVTTNIGAGAGSAEAVAIQPDGKIVVAGFGWVGDSSHSHDTMLARYHPDGRPDYSFGDDGLVVHDLSIGRFEQVYDVVVQPDGRIVVLVGVLYGVHSDSFAFGLARYNADGTLDRSFGSAQQGLVVIDPTAETDSGHALALQPDGKYVVVGGTNVGGNWNYLVVRYTASGAPDSTFGVGGVITTDLGGSDSAYAVGIQADGKIVVAGSTSGDYGLVRYQSNGVIDSSFGTGGVVYTDIGANDSVAGLVVLVDGKIVVGGGNNTGDDWNPQLVRYTLTGSLDAAFGQNGIVAGQLEGVQYMHDMALQPDGRILLVGRQGNQETADLLAIRYNANGTLDSTFGGAGDAPEGILVRDLHDGEDSARSVALQDNGRIVMAGGTYDGSYQIAVSRFLENGIPDTSFGNELVPGVATTEVGTVDEVAGMVRFADGGVLLAGTSPTLDPIVGTRVHGVLARYKPDGALDPAFGDDGLVRVDVTPEDDFVRAVGLQPDGKIVVAGYEADANGGFIARYDSQGVLDPGFGTGGTVMESGLPPIGALMVQPDGRVVVAGGGFMRRYHATGTFDTAFPGAFYGLRDLAIAPDGDIVATGQGDLGRVVVIRYNNNATLDTAFGAGGTVLLEVGVAASPYSVEVDDGGRVVVAGSSNTGTSHDLFVLRLTTTGVLDNSFGSNGLVFTEAGGEETAYDLVLLPDGKILAAGAINLDGYVAARRHDLLLVRYNSNGSLDPSFGDGTQAGIVTLNVGQVDVARALDVSPTGAILLGGTLDDDFALWLYDERIHSARIIPGEETTLTFIDGQGMQVDTSVPAGAVGEPVTLLFEPEATPPIPDPEQFGGVAFSLTVYRHGQALGGYAFEQPVTITVQYADASITQLDENELRLYMWDDGQWIDAADSCAPPSAYDRDPNQNRLSVSICHLTLFALMVPDIDSQHDVFLPFVVRTH